MIERNTVHQMEAIELMKQLDDASVDAYILDLPYGTTACTWDTIIPFEPMWAEVKRTLKPRGVFVTTASQPFTSKLVMSNLAWFKYEWIWDKVHKGNIFLASYQPLKTHESVLVFSPNAHSYYPQMRKGEMRNKQGYGSKLWDIKGTAPNFNDDYYPSSIIQFSSATQSDKDHPTQKPVALYEYLIRTYTQPGELVVDFCCGSGTTAVAARNTKRDFIVGDTDAHYCNVARERLRQPYERHYVKRDEDVTTMDVKDGYKNHLFAVSDSD